MIFIVISVLLHTAKGFAENANITDLSIINGLLEKLPDLKEYPNLLHLRLDFNHIETFDQNSTSLQSFSLVSNHISALHQSNLFYPNLTFLDFSSNPIEYISENFFSAESFPQLKILKLVKALNQFNPFLTINRIVSLANLHALEELYLDENDLEEFFCSKNTTHMQWKLPPNLRRLSLSKNRLALFDSRCLSSGNFLLELDLHQNYLEKLSSIDSLPIALQTLRLDSNFFSKIPAEFLRSMTNLTELDLSMNPLNFLDDENLFPENLKILHLRKMTNKFSCSTFQNLRHLEFFDLSQLQTNELDVCLFKKFTRLKTLNLSNHRLTTVSKGVFHPLLRHRQLENLDLRSETLHCDSCSLHWLFDYLQLHNETLIRCSNGNGDELLFNTFKYFPCPKPHLFSVILIIISISLALCLFILGFIYVYYKPRIPWAKCSPMYHLVPLRHPNRVYENTTEDITNDNVMLVT